MSHNPLIRQTDKSVRIKCGEGEQRQRLRGGEQPAEPHGYLRSSPQFEGEGVAAAWTTARGRAPEVSRGCLTIQLKTLE